MKKNLLLVVTIFVVLCAVIIIYKDTHNSIKNDQEVMVQPTDYSEESNWMCLDKKLEFPVDTIYLYPTSTIEPAEEGGVVGAIDAVHKERAKLNYDRTGAAFSSYTNMFAPYYRQISAKELALAKSNQDVKALVKNSDIVKNDVFAALDYYFTNLNNGRPFIISSHSQGSFVFQVAIEEYFPKHPEYLKRMVAAYMVGAPITQKWLEENNLQFAKGETDTGVLICWFTEGPNAKGGSLGKCLSINPLNWKTDATPATVDQNKGSVVLEVKSNKIVKSKGIADATINLNRGTVVCTTLTNYLPDNTLFGNKSFHIDDYALYFENIKENGQKRIQAYLEKNKK